MRQTRAKIETNDKEHVTVTTKTKPVGTDSIDSLGADIPCLKEESIGRGFIQLSASSRRARDQVSRKQTLLHVWLDRSKEITQNARQSSSAPMTSIAMTSTTMTTTT